MSIDGQNLDYEPVTPSRADRLSRENEAATAKWLPLRRDPSNREQPIRNESESAKPDEPSQQASSSASKVEVWSRRRGHALSFGALFLYTAIAYFRPYELSPVLSWTIWLPYWMAIGMLVIFIPSQFILEGQITARPREVTLLLLLALVAIFSIPQAISPELAWKTFNTTFMKTIIVFIVMVNAMRTERRLRTMMLLALIAGVVMSATAMSDYATGKTSHYGERAAAAIGNMFGEPNSLALHLVTMIPIAIALLMGSSNILKKTLYLAGALIMFTGVLATLSRGGFLGLVAVGFVMAWKLGRRNRIAAIGVMFIAAIAAMFLAPGGYEERMLSIINPSGESSASARQALLTRSFWVALTSPLLGVGIGNLQIVLIHDQVSHNAFTQVAGDMGLFALALYVMFMAFPYIQLKRIERETLREVRHSRYYYLSVGLQASLIGYMVSSFFLSVAYDWYVYFLVGYAVCFRRVYATQTAASEAVVAEAVEPAQRLESRISPTVLGAG